MKKTGKYLKDLRIKKGLTMGDVSQMAGGNIEKTTISRIERGERGISLKAGFYLSQIYGVSMEEIAKNELGRKARIKKLPKKAKKKKLPKKAKKKPGRKKKKRK